MSKLMPTEPKPTGQTPATDAATAPDLELTMRAFWDKNGKMILVGTALILAVIVGKTAYDYIGEQREKSIAADYAAATATPEKLKAFISAHSGHTLAGVGQLRLADEAYTAANYADSIALYQQATATLKTGPMAARAQLGEAIAKLQLGQTTEGETKLKAVVADASLPKPIRAEAAYHLAALAFDAKRNDDASKFLDQINTIDPAGLWARRAMGLRSRVSATP